MGRRIFTKVKEGSHGSLESMMGFGLGLQREEGSRVIWGRVPRRRVFLPRTVPSRAVSETLICVDSGAHVCFVFQVFI